MHDQVNKQQQQKLQATTQRITIRPKSSTWGTTHWSRATGPRPNREQSWLKTAQHDAPRTVAGTASWSCACWGAHAGIQPLLLAALSDFKDRNQSLRASTGGPVSVCGSRTRGLLLQATAAMNGHGPHARTRDEPKIHTVCTVYCQAAGCSRSTAARWPCLSWSDHAGGMQRERTSIAWFSSVAMRRRSMYSESTCLDANRRIMLTIMLPSIML